jgi:hypothetical protein
MGEGGTREETGSRGKDDVVRGKEVVFAEALDDA